MFLSDSLSGGTRDIKPDLGSLVTKVCNTRVISLASWIVGLRYIHSFWFTKQSDSTYMVDVRLGCQNMSRRASTNRIKDCFMMHGLIAHSRVHDDPSSFMDNHVRRSRSTRAIDVWSNFVCNIFIVMFEQFFARTGVNQKVDLLLNIARCHVTSPRLQH